MPAFARRARVSAFNVIAVVFLVLAGQPVAAQETPAPSLEADQGDYIAGDLATFYGSGFAPWETVDLTLSIDEPVTGTHITDATWPTLTADENGQFVALYEVPLEANGMVMTVSATGGAGSTASMLLNNPASITTDQPDYEPGTPATIIGNGFLAYEQVELQVVRADGALPPGVNAEPWITDVGPNGEFATLWWVCQEDCIGQAFIVFARGLESELTAIATFTDHTVTVGSSDFGNSSEDDVDGWTEANDGDDDDNCRVTTDTPLTGAHARLEDDCTITRTFTLLCNNNAFLNYFWRGDSDAENTDFLIVRVSINGGGFNTVATHILDDGSSGTTETTAWSTLQTISLAGVSVGSTITVQFQGDTTNDDEEARVDTVTITADNHASDGTSCSDNLYCTGTDTCSAGVCVSSGDPCAASIGDNDSDCSESCNESNDSCTATDDDGEFCNDGNLCNGADTCDEGDCDDHEGNPCSSGDDDEEGGDNDADCSESCDPATGLCTANDPAGFNCDDGLFCNGDEDECDGSGGCTLHDEEPCDDVGDNDSDCSESCNEATDQCNLNDPAGSPCNDGLFCTATDTCNGSNQCGGTGDPCAARVGDGDTDCSESCSESADSCSANDPAGASCTDNLFCNGLDTCNGSNSCSGHAGDPCLVNVGDGDADCSESCNESTDLCTLNDPAGGACLADANPCTTDVCGSGGAAGTCTHPAGNAGAICRPDGGDCDVAETCTGSSTTCPADGFESAGFQCGSQDNTDCDNPNACNATGTCLDNNEPDETACTSDDNDCTVDECSAGECEHDNEPQGTACGSQTEGECDNKNTCNDSGVCQENHVADGTGCTTDSNDCTADECSAGECGHENEPVDTPCGSQTESDCDDKNTCNATGTCLDNFVTAGESCTDDGETCTTDTCDGAGECAHPAGNADTVCRPDGGDCDLEEKCDGTNPTCPENGFEAEGFTCGSQSESDCDNKNTCNATGTCLDNFVTAGESCPDDGETCTTDTCDGAGECAHPAGNAGTVCRIDGGACDVEEKCDGTSTTCPENGFEQAGTTCGSPANTDCDNPDQCNATGTCLPNNEPNGTTCTTDYNDCTNDRCSAGVCGHTNVYAGTACGSQANTDCDNPNTCNAYGSCQQNYEANGYSCPDDGMICTTDTCNGSGSCTHPAGNSGTVCRPDAGDCDVAETCNGTSTTCPTNGFDPAGTYCGSANDTECDNRDSCNASGVCLPNNVADGTDCTSDTNPCTVDECDGGECIHAGADGDCTSCSKVTNSSLCPIDNDEARLIYLGDPIVAPDGKVNLNSYRLNASNPGQFYYNVFSAGTPGDPVDLTIDIPFPFITQGATPIHVYNGADLKAGSCYVPKTEVSGCTIDTSGGNFSSNGSAVIKLGDYVDQTIGSTTSVYIYDCDLPASGVLYVAIHLDFGVKKTTGWTQNTTTNAANHAPLELGDSNVTIADHQEYDFDFGAGVCASATTGTTNAFKKNPGVNGVTLQTGSANPKGNVKVQLINPSAKVVATATTDADGVYLMPYKHTGKAANYTVNLPDLKIKQTVQLKANGYAIVVFENLP